MEEHSVQTTVSGRYLLRAPLARPQALLIAGFHGYGQSAEDELELLASIPGSERCTLCSIEALHPFYTPKGKPGACWMTSHRREARIGENIHYVDAVIGKVLNPSSSLVFHGFSQGAGMAARAALLGSHPVSGLMLLGGDIPAELVVTERMVNVHIARGNRDPIYKAENFGKDCSRLKEAGVAHVCCTFAGGHEAAAEYLESAGRFLEALSRSR